MPFFQSARFDPDYLESFGAHYNSVNVFVQREGGFPDGTAVVGQMLVPDEELVTTEFYNDWMRPQDYFHVIGGVLLRDGSVIGKLTTLRSGAAGQFIEADLGVYRRLIPHLRGTLKLHRELASIRARSDALREAIDLLPMGVILIGMERRVVEINRSAEAILKAGDGLHIDRAGSIRTDVPKETATLTQLIFDAIDAGIGTGSRPGGAMTLSRSGAVDPCRHW